MTDNGTVAGKGSSLLGCSRLPERKPSIIEAKAETATAVIELSLISCAVTVIWMVVVNGLLTSGEMSGKIMVMPSSLFYNSQFSLVMLAFDGNAGITIFLH